MKGKLSQAKGKAFEQKFSIYMMTELKYDSIKRRKSMTGSESIKGSEADIIGVIYDIRGKRLKTAGLMLIGLAILLAICILAKLIHYDFAYFFLLFAVGGIIYVELSKKLNDKYTWVECKNRKNATDLRTVRDFYNVVQDYNNSKDKKISISKMIFVSASGFVDNALQFAVSKNIDCYKLNDKSFEKIEY